VTAAPCRRGAWIARFGTLVAGATWTARVVCVALVWCLLGAFARTCLALRVLTAPGKLAPICFHDKAAEKSIIRLINYIILNNKN